MTDDYTLPEMMVIQAARELAGAGNVLVGMGLPMLAAALCKLTHDPALNFITEVGAGDWNPLPAAVDHAPRDVGDPILHRGAAYLGDMVDALGGWLMGGRIDAATLTGAEVDRFGNLNTLLIGDPARPNVRFPGTGGNTDAACLAPRVITMMSLEPRRFVERVSFLASPAYITGPGARRRAGLAPQGPNVLVSTMGVFGFDTPDGGDSGSCEMTLTSVFTGFEASDVRALLPWAVPVAEKVRRCEPPTPDEIHAVRYLDPGQRYLVPGRY